MLIEHKWTEQGPGTQRPVTTRLASFESVPEEVLFLRNMVNVYRTTATIRETALGIVFDWAGVPAKWQAAQALAIGDWVQRNVHYVNELPERFQTPIYTLRSGAGDCDDHSTLICALCESIGIPSELVAMQIRGWFRHIFPRALVTKIRGRSVGRLLKIPLDSTLDIPVRRLVDPVRVSVARGDDLRLFTA